MEKDIAHTLHYRTKFVGTNGGHYVDTSDSLVIWSYVLMSDDHLKLDFKVLTDLISFSEVSYKTTMQLSDFVSPAIALHELRSGDGSLRSAIRAQFPDFNFHTLLVRHMSMNVSTSHFCNHEILYYVRPSKEAKALWVLDRHTTKIEIKRNTCRKDWICYSHTDLPEIDLQGYR